MADILFVLRPEKILRDDSFPDLLAGLEEQSRMTVAFIRRLRSQLVAPCFLVSPHEPRLS